MMIRYLIAALLLFTAVASANELEFDVTWDAPAPWSFSGAIVPVKGYRLYVCDAPLTGFPRTNPVIEHLAVTCDGALQQEDIAATERIVRTGYSLNNDVGSIYARMTALYEVQAGGQTVIAESALSNEDSLAYNFEVTEMPTPMGIKLQLHRVITVSPN